MEDFEHDKGAQGQPGMQALTRGLRVLDFVAEAGKPVRFTALLEATGYPKGTLHRLMQTLVDERYLLLEPRSQSYTLGARPFYLAHRVWEQFDLRGAAEPELLRLCALSNETARLGILEGQRILYIDQKDPDRPVRLSNGIGAAVAIHASALGKAIAAHLPEMDRRRLISEGGLEAFTDSTITTNGDLIRQLNIIKARGYAISMGEQHDEVSAVAAAILDHRAHPIGAIGIVGPCHRLSAEALHALGKDAMEAARRVAGNVGELAMSLSTQPRPLRDIGDNIECAIPGEDFLGEGPFWSVAENRLHWVDILAPALVSGDPSSGARCAQPMSELVGVAIPKRSGGFICATESGIKALSARGETTLLADPEADMPGNRFNDGKCDASGRLWVGSLAINTEPDRGALWRIDPDGTAVKMLDRIHIANGLGWSPDNSVFYFTDSARRVIWAFDFDLEAGLISNQRKFVELSENEGTPDGLCVDSEGHVWSAIWDGWSIRRFAPDGRAVETIQLPVPRPTSCCFGGPDLSTLFVTTARIRLSAQQLADAPLSGSVLAVRTTSRGQPDNLFAR